MSSGKYDLIRRLHHIQLSSCVELGTLQQLALTVIVNCYLDKRGQWIHSMPCIPISLREEICKRLMYKGVLDNDLFSLCIDRQRKVWDLRQVREHFSDQSCEILGRAKDTEILRLNHPSCSPESFKKLFTNLKKLRLLEVMNAKNMNDEVVQVVAENCGDLEVLNVKATSVTDAAMQAITQNNLRLTELDISYNLITEDGINHLLNGSVKCSLKLLRFKRCPMLGSAKIIKDIILSFPNLKDYSFDFNSEELSEIGWALDQLPDPTPGQNVFFNIPL